MDDVEKKIIEKAIEYTEPYRPIEKDKYGECNGPWPWLDVLWDAEYEMLEELCLLIQEHLESEIPRP